MHLVLPQLLLACLGGLPRPASEPPAEALRHEAHNPRIPHLGRRPVEAERGEPTLWIRGQVEGVDSGQVRFHEPDGDRMRVICIAEIVQGRFEAEAPPHSPLPVFVSVVALPDYEPVEGPHAFGVLEDPIRLAGEDLEISLRLGDAAPWMHAAEPPIDRLVQVKEVFDNGP